MDWKRVAFKLLGLAGTLGVIAAFYWILPEYQRSYYQWFWDLLDHVLPVTLVLSVPYFIWMDRRMEEPCDGYWHAGLLFWGEWQRLDRRALLQHALGWTVKAFFLPLMYTFFMNDLLWFRQVDLYRVFHNREDLFAFSISVLYLLDVTVATVGYLMTIRVVDSHIRSTEPTVSGWAAAVLCYPPLWAILSGPYFAYDTDGLQWTQWLSGQPALYVAWGAAIIFFLSVYVWATLCFGIRFSNLTHRGIITNGAYRWTKHPAYLGKVMVFWLVSIPFICKQGPGEAMKNCLMLVGVNLIYLWRARTEERHLSRDPIYVQYALAMNEKSIFRWVADRIPWFRYKAPSESA